MADWIPGAVVGLGTGIAGTFARMWRTEAVFAVRIEASEKKLDEFIAQYKAERKDLVTDLKEAAEGMRKAAMEIAGLAREQAVINQMHTVALRGLIDRQEAQSVAIATLHERISKA
jgi:hypothetical protein